MTAACRGSDVDRLADKEYLSSVGCRYIVCFTELMCRLPSYLGVKIAVHQYFKWFSCESDCSCGFEHKFVSFCTVLLRYFELILLSLSRFGHKKLKRTFATTKMFLDSLVIFVVLDADNSFEYVFLT